MLEAAKDSIIQIPDISLINKAAHEQVLRIDMIYFASRMLSGPSEHPYDGKFLTSPHHLLWWEPIKTHPRVLIESPRDHGKSFVVDQAYPIWRAFHEPNKSGYIFSATDGQAKDLLEKIIYEIETNPKLEWLMPTGRAAARKMNKNAARFSNGHEIKARGYGTKVRGGHPDWIVCDDVLNDEDIYSELIRRKNIDYFYSAITNMIVPTRKPDGGGPLIGQIIVIGTPFHEEDLYASLADNVEYNINIYPAINDAGEPLFPARYNLERLKAREREIGSMRFTREFMCKPINDATSLFPRRLWEQDDVFQHNIKLGMNKDYWDKLGVEIYTGHDLAISAESGADFSVSIVLGIDKRGNHWLVDMQRYKGHSYSQQINQIKDLGKKYDPELMIIESNQMQRIFGDELIRTTDLPIKKYITTASGKNSLEHGVPSLRVLMENGKFRLPRGDAHSIEMTDRLISEFASFGFENGKLHALSGHDDIVMAMFIVCQALRGSAFDFGGDDGSELTADDRKELGIEQAEIATIDAARDNDFGLNPFEE